MLIIVAALMAARLAGELILSLLNHSEVLRHADAPPESVASVVDLPTYHKSVAYTLAKLRFGMLSEVFSTLVVAAVLFSGVLPWLHNHFSALAPGATWTQAFFLVAVLALMSLPSLPFDWWEQFRLEARFGFNKSTPGLWIADRLKDALLSLLIGFPLLWALLSLVNWTGPRWWLWGFVLLFSFQILMLVLYPKLIMPLYNKLSPMPEGELRDRLMKLADRTGFQAKTIEVMDGSKRSGHSNAFFTGFGRFRRIVLFDTLIQQLSQEELEAVLAHEIGHYRRGHVPRMIALSAAMQLGALGLVAWLAAAPWFNTAFGFPAGALAPAFLVFGLLSGTVTFWFSPLGNMLSRKHEYEADAFAREAMGSPAPLIGALRRLSDRNLTNLTPHPLYSGFHYSHPTLVERERALLGG